MKKLPKAKSKYGYTNEELKDLCKKLSITWDNFCDAFGINTCAIINGKPRYYTCDVERALYKLGFKDIGKNHLWD